MQSNWYLVFITALIPLLVGSIWYSPMLFGKAWIQSTGQSEDDLKKGNMALILGLTYFFGLLFSTAMIFMVIHQMHLPSVFQADPSLSDPNSTSSLYIKNFFDTYGKNFRTFKHGAFHGVLNSLFIALPLIGTIALFERKGFKYIAIHIGFWMITMGLIGGCISQWF